LSQIDLGIELNTKVICWHCNLGCYRVTPPLNTTMAILRQYPTSADAKLSTPYMRELMKKREHLPPLSVPTIDKHKWRNRGLQRKSTKLIEV